VKRLGNIRVKIGIAVIIAVLSALLCPATAAFAIDNPDSDPSIDYIWAWRNVLKTGDVFIMILENTPYATTPTDYIYPDAFIWRFMDGDSDEGQAVGYTYNDDGYGYNVIGFYWSATDAPAWDGDYDLRLSGNPTAFDTPPEYNYPIPDSAYSSLTDSDEVKADISEKVILLANLLYTYWGLNSTTTLVAETETATVLSLNGQAFFRGAIYGLQGMAPAAFPIMIVPYSITDRTWTDAYITTLEAQHAGNPIETAFNAGETLLDVDYNLLGLLLVAGISGGLIFANWFLSGGQIWRGLIEAAPILVIGTRMGMLGLGELGLVAALCMLYDNARLWKLI